MGDNARAGDTELNEDKRTKKKCAACRKAKKKCLPVNRDPKERCEYCKKHPEYSCGENRTAKDERVMAKGKGIMDGQEEGSSEDAEQIVGRASSAVKLLNAWGNASTQNSFLPAINCHNHDNPIQYTGLREAYAKWIENSFHHCFIEACKLGRQLHVEGCRHEAHGIHLSLLIILREFRELCDSRKSIALQEVWELLAEFGDYDNAERTVELVRNAPEMSASPHLDKRKNVHVLHAASLLSTSARAHQFLPSLWQDQCGELANSALQRCSHHGLADVAKIILSDSDNMKHLYRPMFDLNPLHIAAIRGDHRILSSIITQSAIEVDARDMNSHTPLFFAAEAGHEGLCSQLLRAHADPNARNRHGNTIMEVAARGGYLNIIRQLVDAGANVNPTRCCCESTPLLAILENPNSSSADEVARYLVEEGADVRHERFGDLKTPIILAAERGLGDLAKMMDQTQPDQWPLGQVQTFPFNPGNQVPGWSFP